MRLTVGCFIDMFLRPFTTGVFMFGRFLSLKDRVRQSSIKSAGSLFPRSSLSNSQEVGDIIPPVVEVYWFQNEAMSQHGFRSRLPRFSKITWMRVDQGEILISNQRCFIGACSYIVKGCKFNVICQSEDMQGDLFALLVLIMNERAFKIEVGLPDLYRHKRGPYLEWRLVPRT